MEQLITEEPNRKSDVTTWLTLIGGRLIYVLCVSPDILVKLTEKLLTKCGTKERSTSTTWNQRALFFQCHLIPVRKSCKNNSIVISDHTYFSKIYNLKGYVHECL